MAIKGCSGCGVSEGCECANNEQRAEWERASEPHPEDRGHGFTRERHSSEPASAHSVTCALNRFPPGEYGDAACTCPLSLGIAPKVPRGETPTMPVRDPAQCPLCKVIHLRGRHCPGKAPSGASLTVGGRIVHGATTGRLEGLYPTPRGEVWALVDWDGGTRSLIEPWQLQTAPVEARRGRHIQPSHELWRDVSTAEDAELARAFLRSIGTLVGTRYQVYYTDTGAPVEDLFGIFVV